jgi:squalene-hopene/tetraprenyl-beta-curcumene cyclase
MSEPRNIPAFKARVQAALAKAAADLLSERNPDGYWTGELSTSALSTATAIIALSVLERHSAPDSPPSALRTPHSALQQGLSWLAANANADGGWGDTTRSLSNISTTALCWAAFGAVPGADQTYPEVVARAKAWLARVVATAGVARSPAFSRLDANEPPEGGTPNLTPQSLAAALIRRYGKDRTFSVPILTACALSGRLGSGPEAWRLVMGLPFELAALPANWFATLQLPVVSYALPALIAIGQARHVNLPSRNPLARLARRLTRARTLKVLERIQPSSGGFLEATPLTSFVVMSLAGSGQASHPVVRKGVEFLLQSQRTDGSWPIDTNLATWVTTLAINALPDGSTALTDDRVKRFLLDQQFRTIHPYTQAAPGGWAWTHLPGGVPDADDTPGALLALKKMRSAECGVRNEDSAGRMTKHNRKTLTDEAGKPDCGIEASARLGMIWLLGLQNRDGGIPTFCRGWGALPFDRSGPDLTAHALRAWLAWREDLGLLERTDPAIRRALQFLRNSQRADGSWVPLWFGNQHAPEDENPAYGTAKVVQALSEARPHFQEADAPLARGASWLLKAQNADGGWGGHPGTASTTEETALVMEALANALPRAGDLQALIQAALQSGCAWLVNRVESGAWKEPAPIGFYFAKLWYYERLYPQIFTVAALRRLVGGASHGAPPLGGPGSGTA